MTTHAPTATTTRGTRRVPIIVVGALLVLLALAPIVGGVVLVGAHATKRDGDGYYTSGATSLASPTHVLVADEIGPGSGSDWLFRKGRLGTVRVTATGTSRQPIFVGIARQSAVDKYLGGVARDEMTDVEVDPFSVDIARTHGTRKPAVPVAQRFWTQQSSGPGRQTVTWRVQNGSWAVVVMNADGSAGIRTELSVGATAGFVLWLGIGLLIGGGILAAAGSGLIALGTRRRAAVTAPPENAAVAAGQGASS